MIGKIIRDLPPSPHNNRNSEGAFIELNDGKILFVYSRYADGGCDDGAAADLYGMISDDNGDSFGEPFPVLKHGDISAENV
ncbi:MAG: exo-alpha-sialidase, partial [Clostridia bacterium]|nr:exo-alpha-sialidase [Clostridia bacterium]